MANRSMKIIENIDHITEELANIKKSLLTLDTRPERGSSKAWNRIVKASQKVKWDEVTAVEEIRMQREKR